MKALTIHQPWAWAILEGIKTVENRSWRTHYRGELWIHASVSKRKLKNVRCSEYELTLMMERWKPQDFHFGAIIGRVQLVDCVPIKQLKTFNEDLGQVVFLRPFAEGPWCWLLEKPEKIMPFQCSGNLSLWTPPAELLRTGNLLTSVCSPPGISRAAL